MLFSRRTSKKRVLGVCARCNKPITAGARQMHMFFHLGKDMQVFYNIKFNLAQNI